MSGLQLCLHHTFMALRTCQLPRAHSVTAQLCQRHLCPVILALGLEDNTFSWKILGLSWFFQGPFSEFMNSLFMAQRVETRSTGTASSLMLIHPWTPTLRGRNIPEAGTSYPQAAFYLCRHPFWRFSHFSMKLILSHSL